MVDLRVFVLRRQLWAFVVLQSHDVRKVGSQLLAKHEHPRDGKPEEESQEKRKKQGLTAGAIFKYLTVVIWCGQQS